MAIDGHKVSTILPIKGKLMIMFACGESKTLNSFQKSFSRTWAYVTCPKCIETKHKGPRGGIV